MKYLNESFEKLQFATLSNFGRIVRDFKQAFIKTDLFHTFKVPAVLAYLSFVILVTKRELSRFRYS
jgi:hypothetical protein